MDGYTVGEVARLARVSVRTLHHYDAAGLLVPSRRSESGYRLYSDADVRRLRQILIYRALDLGLGTIAEMLANPDRGTDDHLRRQHRMLRERIARDRELLRAVETEMEARAMGISLTPEEQFEVFGTDAVGGDWAREAEQRWGDTDAWRESQRRTAAYTKADWVAVKAEMEANLAAFADALRSGEPADGPAARALAEEHRRHISRRFYSCDHEMHRALAEMYVSDERFRRTYDDVEPGLAAYVHDAVLANAGSR